MEDGSDNRGKRWKEREDKTNHGRGGEREGNRKGGVGTGDASELKEGGGVEGDLEEELQEEEEEERGWWCQNSETYKRRRKEKAKKKKKRKTNRGEELELGDVVEAEKALLHKVKEVDVEEVAGVVEEDVKVKGLEDVAFLLNEGVEGEGVEAGAEEVSAGAETRGGRGLVELAGNPNGCEGDELERLTGHTDEREVLVHELDGVEQCYLREAKVKADEAHPVDGDVTEGGHKQALLCAPDEVRFSDPVAALVGEHEAPVVRRGRGKHVERGRDKCRAIVFVVIVLLAVLAAVVRDVVLVLMCLVVIVVDGRGGIFLVLDKRLKDSKADLDWRGCLCQEDMSRRGRRDVLVGWERDNDRSEGRDGDGDGDGDTDRGFFLIVEVLIAAQLWDRRAEVQDKDNRQATRGEGAKRGLKQV